MHSVISTEISNIDKSVIFIKKRPLVLKYLLNLQKFYADTILTYALSKLI